MGKFITKAKQSKEKTGTEHKMTNEREHFSNEQNRKGIA